MAQCRHPTLESHERQTVDAICPATQPQKISSMNRTNLAQIS
jgi:hypothetical protein